MKRIAEIILVVLAAAIPAAAGTFTGCVERVIDGDTIVVRVLAVSDNVATTNACPLACGSLQRVRLAEIDAPEMKQAYGPEARGYLVAMIQGHRMQVEYRRCDRYGRVLGTVYSGDRNLNRAMVAAGYAWRYRYAPKSGRIAEAERHARQTHAGLWTAASPMPPWLFRSRH